MCVFLFFLPSFNPFYAACLLFFLFQAAASDGPPAPLGPLLRQPAGGQHRLHRHQPDSREGPVGEPHGRHADRRVRSGQRPLHRPPTRLGHGFCNVCVFCQECVFAAAGSPALRAVRWRRLTAPSERRNERRNGPADRLHCEGKLSAPPAGATGSLQQCPK